MQGFAASTLFTCRAPSPLLPNHEHLRKGHLTMVAIGAVRDCLNEQRAVGHEPWTMSGVQCTVFVLEKGPFSGGGILEVCFCSSRSI